MSTADLRGVVYQALEAAPMIDAQDIEVDVSQRVVLLNGTVPSQEQVSEATDTARRVPGVADVYNMLAVALPSQDYGNDAALAAEANEALMANASVPPEVRATAIEGNVTLTGTVSTAAQRRAAADAVAGCGGVMSISNEIVIVGAGPPADG